MRSSIWREQSWECENPRRGLRLGDWPLAAGQEPPLGAHMLTPRRGYTHHGIYVGNGSVVHYGGFSHGWRRGPVEEVPLSRFSLGRSVWIRTGESGWRDRPDVVTRARSRLGEDCYHLLKNNCEHLCEWCVRCNHRSHQVDEFLDRIRLVSARFRRTLSQIAMRATVPARRRQELPMPPSTDRCRAARDANVTVGAWIATEHTSYPSTSRSVTWLAGRISTRQRFIRFGRS